MKNIIKSTLISLVFLASFMSYSTVFVTPAVRAEACSQSVFLGFPTWYKYLESEKVPDGLTGGTTCNVELGGINGVWLVLAAIIDILLRLAALVAVGFIIYGGVTYILSQSQPDKVNQALKTTINAVIGLVMAIVATALVTFLAGSFK